MNDSNGKPDSNVPSKRSGNHEVSRSRDFKSLVIFLNAGTLLIRCIVFSRILRRFSSLNVTCCCWYKRYWGDPGGVSIVAGWLGGLPDSFLSLSRASIEYFAEFFDKGVIGDGGACLF